jgi:hypothetical protein
MKLLLDELRSLADVGIIHTIYEGGDKRYTRRRAYHTAQSAAKHYFEYCDTMVTAGYTIKSRLGQAWFFEVCLDGQIVETVEVQWPPSN